MILKENFHFFTTCECVPVSLVSVFRYHAQDDPVSNCTKWYYGHLYKRAYGHNIKSIPDHDQWQEIDEPAILPPIMKRSVGRPSRNRKRHRYEKRKGKRSNTIKCSKCH